MHQRACDGEFGEADDEDLLEYQSNRSGRVQVVAVDRKLDIHIPGQLKRRVETITSTWDDVEEVPPPSASASSAKAPDDTEEVPPLSSVKAPDDAEEGRETSASSAKAPDDAEEGGAKKRKRGGN
jgi:hypothetical protein